MTVHAEQIRAKFSEPWCRPYHTDGGTLLTRMRCWCRPTHCWLGQTQHTRQSGMCKSRPRWTPPWGDTQLTGTPPWNATCAQPPVCPGSKQQLVVLSQALQELHVFTPLHEQDMSFIWSQDLWP